MKITPQLDENILKGLPYDQAMVASAMESANYAAEDLGLVVPTDEFAATYEVAPSGGRFHIPLAIPEDMLSGDERSFKKGALSSRLLPLPLMWQIKTASGHDGAVVVGRIDYIERVENGLGNARGVFDVGPYGREAERMVRGGFLRGISADLDKFKATTERSEEDSELAESNDIENDKILVSKARLMGITIVAKPAFEECFITMEKEPTLELDAAPVADGIYEETPDDYEYELAALAASAAPMTPPKDWFNNPGLKEATPLTITDDGRVFGHIAAWKTSHIGLGRGVKPPRSATNYAYFRTGVVRTDGGDDVRVGQLTLAGGHASLNASASEAVKHYDDTASAVADVTAGEDAYGIWVSGALRPEVTPSQIRAFRASSPSGDWRPIDGRLELVAVCQVNVPGFPIARAMTAGGAPQAIVAAGAAYLAEIKESNKVADLESRLRSIEQSTFGAKADSARSRMAAVMESRNAELATRAAAAKNRLNAKKVSEEAELSAKIDALRARFNNG